MRYLPLFLLVLLAASAASGLGLDDVTDCLFAQECGDGGGSSAPVPEPGAALAFATGLIALGIGRKRARR